MGTIFINLLVAFPRKAIAVLCRGLGREQVVQGSGSCSPSSGWSFWRLESAQAIRWKASWQRGVCGGAHVEKPRWEVEDFEPHYGFKCSGTLPEIKTSQKLKKCHISSPHSSWIKNFLS